MLFLDEQGCRIACRYRSGSRNRGPSLSCSASGVRGAFGVALVTDRFLGGAPGGFPGRSSQQGRMAFSSVRGVVNDAGAAAARAVHRVARGAESLSRVLLSDAPRLDGETHF